MGVLGTELNLSNTQVRKNSLSIAQIVQSSPEPCHVITSVRNNKKRSHTQLDSRKQVIAFQDRVITINIKEAQHPLK